MENAVWLTHADVGKSNNLNLLRLIAAALVILSHCYVLLGAFQLEPMQSFLRFGDLGGTAVYVFFFISGYLILKSGLRSTVPQFLRARMLRIFPALAVAVLMVTFVLGPAVTSIPIEDYVLDPLTWNYLWELVLHKNNGSLPGVFQDGRAFITVNQPLWTLSTEWLMYMIILAFCFIYKAAKHRTIPSASVSAALALAFMLTAQMSPIPWMHAGQWLAFGALGSAAYIGRRWVPLSVLFAAVIFTLDLLLIVFFPPFGKALFPFALSYMVLVVGFHPALHFQSFHKLGDYSYGLYIFGWPVQQLLLPHCGGSPLTLFAMTIPITTAIAIASWHFIEEPALRMKDANASNDLRDLVSPYQVD